VLNGQGPAGRIGPPLAADRPAGESRHQRGRRRTGRRDRQRRRTSWSRA